MVTPIKSLIGLSALALSAMSFSSVASAAVEPASQTVEYSDLNLASAEGQKRLEIRIKSAVRKVCSSNNRVTLTEKQFEDQCAVQAMQSAMDDAKVAIAEYKSNRRVASSQLPVRAIR